MAEFKDQEQKESMTSTKWLKKIALKSAVTCMGRIHVRTHKTVTKPNGGSHSLGKTSDELQKKKENLHPLNIHSVNEHSPGGGKLKLF